MKLDTNCSKILRRFAVDKSRPFIADEEEIFVKSREWRRKIR